jgi:hypothetical protein
MTRAPRPLWRKVGYAAACFAAVGAGLLLTPVFVVGLALCMTVVLFPLGVLLCTVPGLPLFWVMKAHQKHMAEQNKLRQAGLSVTPGQEPWHEDDYLIALSETYDN